MRAVPQLVGAAPFEPARESDLDVAPEAASQERLRGFAAGNFAGDVALSLTGLLSGVGTASFSPPVIAGAGSSQLTVTTLPTAPGGTYPLNDHRHRRWRHAYRRSDASALRA